MVDSGPLMPSQSVRWERMYEITKGSRCWTTRKDARRNAAMAAPRLSVESHVCPSSRLYGLGYR